MSDMIQPEAILDIHDTSVQLIEAPTAEDWLECKRRALVTVGLRPKTAPGSEWKHSILEARHSPIRRLVYTFGFVNLPYYVSVHLARHVHAQPYIQTERNDRQACFDRRLAPQAAPVMMLWDINAEELQIIANKRLCNLANSETRSIVLKMCALAESHTPELHGLLVPLCDYCGGVCHEMYPCGKHHTTGGLENEKQA